MVTEELVLHLQTWDQIKMVRTAEAFVLPGGVVGLLGNHLAIRNGSPDSDSLFYPTASGFVIRAVDKMLLFLRDRSGLRQVIPEYPGMDGVRHFTCTLTLDPWDRGYVLVNTDVGISFEFVPRASVPDSCLEPRM